MKKLLIITSLVLISTFCNAQKNWDSIATAACKEIPLQQNKYIKEKTEILINAICNYGETSDLALLYRYTCMSKRNEINDDQYIDLLQGILDLIKIKPKKK